MDFKAATNEWIAIKTQLASARKDLSMLNKREKELRQFVTHHMVVNEIDTLRIQDKVKVNVKKTKKKGSITKDVIKAGLRVFFSGNEEQVESAFKAILEAAPTKETAGVTVTGLKA
jgi:spore coat polysaccharide biosynthesis protein SpsF (cytidylyltransferase family)